MAVGRRRGRRAVIALGLAVAIDLVASEPPARLHPVVWIGSLIDAAVRRAPRGAAPEFTYGSALALAVPALAGATAAAVERGCERLPEPLPALTLALALKPSFALRALLDAGLLVERSLAAADLDGARTALRALVSRETADLDAGLAAAAAIESLAENLGDGLAGPLLAYAAFGLPGAWAYRALNTLDSMVGYRGRFEWLGKASARLDDLANLLPARVSALTLALAAPAAGGSVHAALRVGRRDRAATASPNAGRPMATAAGALGLRLEKRDHYVLNAGGRTPTADDVRRARTLVAGAAGLIVAVAVALASRDRGAQRAKAAT